MPSPSVEPGQFAKYPRRGVPACSLVRSCTAVQTWLQWLCEQLEKHQKRISPFILASDDEGAIQCYTEALAAARAFGDSEGVRHNLHAIAHRCDAKARTAEAAKYKAEADQLEQILGKPSSAKQIFSRLDGLPSMQTDLPEQLGPRPATGGQERATAPRSHCVARCPGASGAVDLRLVTITVNACPPASSGRASRSTLAGRACGATTSREAWSLRT